MALWCEKRVVLEMRVSQHPFCSMFTFLVITVILLALRHNLDFEVYKAQTTCGW